MQFNVSDFNFINSINHKRFGIFGEVLLSSWFYIGLVMSNTKSTQIEPFKGKKFGKSWR